ncbi:hypothetical protein Nepgr_011587 [Nepenthes gracilis]|uniref:Uncharacterized protein n=1 Tax=Nepenthes gracilis TaxID=150966 RepID=A0AAD3SFT0_NEPGR|nr:hypothetical protein Nepgr_011587 [Nepenthes gracilis]
MLVQQRSSPGIPPKAPAAIHLGDHHELIQNREPIQGSPTSPAQISGENHPIQSERTHSWGSPRKAMLNPSFYGTHHAQTMSMAQPKEESTG